MKMLGLGWGGEVGGSGGAKVCSDGAAVKARTCKYGQVKAQQRNGKGKVKVK